MFIMKTKYILFLTLSASLLFSLSCQLANAMTGRDFLRVESVDVVPSPTTYGQFTAEVAIPFHNNDGVLICYIPQGNGKSKEVYNQNVKGSEASTILRFDFQYTEPGPQKLYCSDSEYKSETAKTQFVVPPPPSAQEQPSTSSTDPVTIKGSGNWRLYNSDGNSCPAPQNSVLIVQPDGSALLSASGSGFIDHINCTKSAGLEGWEITGIADLNTETVTFSKCNGNGFRAEGKMNYQSGKLAGLVRCFGLKGEINGKLMNEISVP
jgi:hypothetical protein